MEGNMKVIFRILFASAFALLLTGCGSSSHVKAQQTTSLPPTTTNATTIATPTATPVPVKTHFVTHEYVLKSGYTYEETYTIWETAPNHDTTIVSHPLDDTFTPSNFDPEKDLAIPMQIQIQNTTESFNLDDATTTAGLFRSTKEIDENMLNYLDKFKTIEILVNYSNGTTTYEWELSSATNNLTLFSTDYWSISWPSLSPNHYGQVLFFIIVHDYYTPAFPDGNSKLLDLLFVGTYALIEETPHISFSGKQIVYKET